MNVSLCVCLCVCVSACVCACMCVFVIVVRSDHFKIFESVPVLESRGVLPVVFLLLIPHQCAHTHIQQQLQHLTFN